MKSVTYYCLADEIGLDTGTPHTHIFFAAKSPIKFSRVKNLFPEAHIEQTRGSSTENRDYVKKSGKWADDVKVDSSIPDTFEEWGDIPDEPGQGYRTDMAQIYTYIHEGLSNAEIMAINPEAATHIGKFDKIRQAIFEERYRTAFRDLSVTYIFGPTETGKTRFVMEEHGYDSVYRVTDYAHPFDQYHLQPVICFDEFRSSLMVGDMLNYLDGYPLSLPARYANRVACYTTVYIISNVSLKNQFPNVQQSDPKTWEAFVRRIHRVVEYRQNETPLDHGTGWDYVFPASPSSAEWHRYGREISDPGLYQNTNESRFLYGKF